MSTLQTPGLEDIDLSDSRMFKVTMPCAQLDDANLSGANLQEVNLSGAHIQYSDLSNANIGADLSGSFFLESKLSQAHILGSDLSGARILRTDMSGALLRDTNLTGTYFYDPRGGTGSSPVTGLTQAQLDAARADPDNPPRLDGFLTPRPVSRWSGAASPWNRPQPDLLTNTTRHRARLRSTATN